MLFVGESYQELAGIGDARCTGIRNQGNGLACGKPADEFRRFPMLVVFVKADHRALDVVPGEELGRAARVFRGDEINLAKRSKCPKCDVLEIADRRRDDEEGAGHERVREL